MLNHTEIQTEVAPIKNKTEVVCNIFPIPTTGATAPPTINPLAPNAAEATPAFALSLSKAIAVGTGCNNPKANKSITNVISVNNTECTKFKVTTDKTAAPIIINAPYFILFLPAKCPAAAQPNAIANALTAKHKLNINDDNP